MISTCMRMYIVCTYIRTCMYVHNGVCDMSMDMIYIQHIHTFVYVHVVGLVYVGQNSENIPFQ